MPDKLPKGWVKTTLGEVCAMNPRPSYDELPPEETEVSFVPMAAVEEESGRLDASGVRTLAAARKGYTPFKENDVIFAKITPCMENGKIALATGLKNGLAYGSTEFFVFRPYEGLLPRFVLHFLLQSSFRNEAQSKMAGAVGQKRVPSNYLFTHPFPLPPTPEQERIVAKLDALLSRVSAGEAAACRALERLKRYRAAVLHAAVTGELTRDWRKTHKPDETSAQLLKRLLHERRARWEATELKRLQTAGNPPKDDKWNRRYRVPAAPELAGLPDLPRSWTWASWNQISDWVTYGFTRPMPHVEKGIPIVTAKHVKERRLDYSNTHLTTRTAYEKLSAKDLPQDGDILITKDGTIGRAAVVDGRREFCINQSVAVIWLRSSDLERRYLLNVIESNDTQTRIWAKARGVAIKHLSITDFARMALPLPPLEEQAEIVSEVERRFAAADHLAITLNRQLHRARATRQSLLREAFTGKLTPQNPNDGPASILLDRIRAARESEANKPKPKRMPKTKLKSVETLEQLEGLVHDLGKGATPDRLLLAAGLGADVDAVEKFFDLLRVGRDKNSLLVPVGKGTAIRRVKHAN